MVQGVRGVGLPEFGLEQVVALSPAPSAPPAERYRGDSVTTTMSALGPADRATIRVLYGFLLEVYATTQGHLNDTDGGVGALTSLVDNAGFESLMERITTLGSRLHASEVSAEVKRSLHDIRGGSLMALVMHMDMALEGLATPEDVQRVFILSRDHLKMMRNAVRDLDEERYNADLHEKAHSVSLLRQKWTDVSYRAGSRRTQVHLHCNYEGSVSQRCMEFSALDRVLYNLVNNASQHAQDDQVQLFVTPVGEGENLRFAVVNRVSEDQRSALQDRFGDSLSSLFHGGFTTGGHGIGLRVCGDFVAHGYQREGVAQAIEDGLLGVDLVGPYFVAWFHWPAEPGAAV